MGLGSSKLEKQLNDLPAKEKYFGLENFGNTCYCNSVLQALYFCEPFRGECIQYYNKNTGPVVAGKAPPAVPLDESTLLLTLSEMFSQIYLNKKRTGVFQPRRFITKLKNENELFNNNMHQDAHEFLNYLLNEIEGQLTREQRAEGPSEVRPAKNWVHEIFQGIMTNETKCLCCETVTSREESFLDLSLEVEPNVSVSHCLRNFSSEERLGGMDKFYCDKCCSLQEAQKTMKIKRLPSVLALHLKRFKYIEEIARHRKLATRVVFPLEMRLPNTSVEADDPDRIYDLFAFVIHIGSGPNHGHYIAIVKSHDKWLLFDDDNVEIIEESNIQQFFGTVMEFGAATESGYILFYQSRDYINAYRAAVAAREASQMIA